MPATYQLKFVISGCNMTSVDPVPEEDVKRVADELRRIPQVSGVEMVVLDDGLTDPPPETLASGLGKDRTKEEARKEEARKEEASRHRRRPER